MRSSGTLISLNEFFRRQSVKWSLIGLGLTVAFAIPCLVFATKLSAERLVSSDARSAAYSFREKILSGAVRDAQFQMRRAIELSEAESAIVRDPELHAIYPIAEQDKISHFEKPGTYAWSPYFSTVSTLSPIYFGDDTTLFGYLELTRKPHFEWPLLGFLAVALLVAFSIQSFGLISALRTSSLTISSAMEAYAAQIRVMNKIAHAPQKASFKEFSVMQKSVESLHSEIEELKSKTAQQAKESAQYSILREVTHDLKTPLSQLAKFQLFAFDNLRKGKPFEEQDLVRMERALVRASELVRQVNLRHQSPRTLPAPVVLDSVNETKTIVDDLQHLTDIEMLGISLELLTPNKVPSISMTRTEYYQILENLVRNAAESISIETEGRIIVSLFEENGSATLRVSDNGRGIPEHLRSKIFDFDVTTKAGHGTGIGLGIVRRICAQHSASISFSSNSQGTTFTVQFSGEAAKGLTIRQYEEAKQYEHKV